MATKTHVIEVHRRGKCNEVSGTLEELTKYFEYTLDTGRSYQHEKGNKKINCKPRTIKGLVSNLNNAKTNAAANGCADTSYSLKVETVEKSKFEPGWQLSPLFNIKNRMDIGNV